MKHIKTSILVLLISGLFLTELTHAAFKYQDFEPNNGTPKKSSDPTGSPPEYGWGFNGAVVRLSQANEPVHTGVSSWQLTVPAGDHVVAGTGIPSSTQTYDMNFVPECHDRLTFWIWSNPSVFGDHTVMVKFFDRGKYKQDGIGIWTKEEAKYQQWTPLSILFSQVPQDFDWGHVDKIEFFDYWDGTYYYDDVEIDSAFSAEHDIECLKKQLILICPSVMPNEIAGTKPSVQHQAIVGLSEKDALCTTLFDEKADIAVDYMQMRIRRKNTVEHKP